MRVQILLFMLMLLLLSCNGQQKKEIKESKLVSVQLSPNDNQLLLSYFNNDQGAIYTCNIDGENIKLLIKPEGKETYTHPRYSPDGNKILFIEFSEDLKSSAIFIIDKTGENKRQITEFSKLTTEAIFSQSGDSLFYCKANEFEKYSPIAAKAPHDMDIYVTHIELKKEIRLTNLGAYSISNLALFQKGSAIMFNEETSINYIYLSNPDKKEAFHARNFNNLNILGYSSFLIQDSETCYFLAMGNYVLFKMNIEEKEAIKVLHNNFQINNLGIFNNKNKILFTKNLPGNMTVTFVDLDSHTSKDVLIRAK